MILGILRPRVSNFAISPKCSSWVDRIGPYHQNEVFEPQFIRGLQFFREKVKIRIADIVVLQPTSSFTLGGRSDRAKIVPEMSRWITVIGQSPSPDFNSTATLQQKRLNVG